jgi:hypothetical protein
MHSNKSGYPYDNNGDLVIQIQQIYLHFGYNTVSTFLGIPIITNLLVDISQKDKYMETGQNVLCPKILGSLCHSHGWLIPMKVVNVRTVTGLTEHRCFRRYVRIHRRSGLPHLRDSLHALCTKYSCIHVHQKHCMPEKQQYTIQLTTEQSTLLSKVSSPDRTPCVFFLWVHLNDNEWIFAFFRIVQWICDNLHLKMVILFKDTLYIIHITKQYILGASGERKSLLKRHKISFHV